MWDETRHHLDIDFRFGSYVDPHKKDVQFCPSALVEVDIHFHTVVLIPVILTLIEFEGRS